MKWIKASDRMPKDWSSIQLRLIDGKTPIIHIIGVFEAQLHCMYFDSIDYDGSACIANDLTPYDEIEWLDETPEATPQVKNLSHFLQWLNDNHSIEIHDMIIQDYMKYGTNKTSIDIAAIISEVEQMHPYSQPGNHDTFSQYNEGWADACDILGNKIKEALGIPVPVVDVDKYINSLIERAGTTWKGVDVQKFMDMVKGMEEE